MAETQGPYRILVVDDEPDLEPLVLQRMRRSIRSGRYQFVFARNGVEALQKLGQDEDIDMVLSDINMPQMDGLALLEHIPDVAPDTRSVIISAYGDMKNIRAAMNRGAFDFVTKPVDFDDLRVTIERTLTNLETWREAMQSRDRLVALEHELDVANKMQQAILPTVFPATDAYQTYGSMTPAREVGGDFFDITPLDDGRIGLAIADVSDKGVPAALFMMSSRTLLKGSAIGLGQPGNILREVNDLLYADNETMMFVTLLYAVYDPATGQLTYANGGHNLPVIVHRRRLLRHPARHRRHRPRRPPRRRLRTTLHHHRPRRQRHLLHRRRHRSRQRRRRGIRHGTVERRLRRRRRAGLPVRYPGRPGRRQGLRRRSPPIRRHYLPGPAPQRVSSAMPEAISLTIAPRHDQLDQITAAVEELGERDNWPLDLVFKVNLVLEELGVNVVNYSGDASEIAISLASDEHAVSVEIVDDGPPFNPLADAVEPDLDAPLEDRPIGGLGIHLVREMMDELHYSREEGKNRLAMVKLKTG